MRILFVVHKPSFVRYFESVVEELADRGHQVHLAVKAVERRQVTRRNKPGPEQLRRIDERSDAMIAHLCARHPGITRGPTPVRADRWSRLTVALRRSIDYLRYLSPTYAGAPKLRARAARHTPDLTVRLTGSGPLATRLGTRLLDRALRFLDSAVPGSGEIDRFVHDQAPDLLLITPLMFEPWQSEYVGAAQRQGVRSALCVASWDNLTNKGLIQTTPDRIYVWNEHQRREAVELHGVDRDRVVATGAPLFDQWFAREPSTGPDDFRRRLGFPADRPLVLYACSYDFIAPREPAFVARWLEGLRAHPDERLRDASVLIRPHPRSAVRWEESPLSAEPGVTVWPPAGALPTDEESKASYFDSLFHSAAVVGINTSAFVESAIVGRSVFTVLDPEFADTQEGTLHFHHLLRANGGPLTVAHSLSEHLDQLAGELGRQGPDEQARRFVHHFVRPAGVERPALSVMVDALEHQAHAPAPAPVARQFRQALGRFALLPAAELAERGVLDPAAKRRRLRLGKRVRRRLKPARRRLAATKRASRRTARRAAGSLSAALRARSGPGAEAAVARPPEPDGRRPAPVTSAAADSRPTASSPD